MTRDEIMKTIEEQDIHLFRLQFVDIFGYMKNVAVPLSQIEKALDGQMMFDGSSIDGFVRIDESDMYLKPDYDSFVVLPWRNQNGRNAARVICDVYKSDGTPFDGCPRNNLKRVLAEAKAMGYTMNVGTEAEFFLFKKDEAGNATTITNDVAGYLMLTQMIQESTAVVRLLRSWRIWVLRLRRPITKWPRDSMKSISSTLMP